VRPRVKCFETTKVYDDPLTKTTVKPPTWISDECSRLLLCARALNDLIHEYWSFINYDYSSQIACFKGTSCQKKF
jgi:hypothetical protein